ncbi:MAG: class I SAM-dependent methyltransferase [candidate division Zixibacteria bacterium]|nr:class I SAM-dependent methyltransferase [candidate division Zixibacteria bacterium]
MSQSKHQEFFDQLAAEWDLMFTAIDLEFLSHIVDGLSVEEGMDILDLGCSTGILFDMLRRKTGKSGSVTGVDFSFEMARKAHRNFPFPNVNVVGADAHNLPFADSTFDMAVAFSAFPHFADQRRTLEETHRVLKNNSHFCIIHLASSKEISEAHHRKGGVLENDDFPPADKLREMFHNSQFTNVTIEDHPGLFFVCSTNLK